MMGHQLLQTDSPDKSTSKAEPLPPVKPVPATDVFKFDSSITLLLKVGATWSDCNFTTYVCKDTIFYITKVTFFSVPLSETKK